MKYIPSVLQPFERKLRAKLSKGSFGHNVLIMFLGTAIGQFSAVLLSPVLTRLFTPESFGILGAYTALLTVLSVLSMLRYEMALPLTKTDDDLANLLGVCCIVLLAVTGIGFAIAAWLALGSDEWGSLEVLRPYWWLLPVGFFAIGAYQLMVYFATRLSAFDAIAKTKIYQGLAGPLTQIGLGVAGVGTWGLIVGFVVGQSMGVSQLVSRLVLTRKDILKLITREKMKAIAIRFKHFPLVSSWSGLMNSAGGTSVLLFLIPLLYSSTIAGFVFLTDRVIGRPLLMISTSILQVYIGDVSQSLKSDPSAIKKRFLKLAFNQFCIVALWLGVVNLLAPWFFPFVFGDEWAAAVPYLQVLSIAYLPQMVMSALAHTLQIMEKQRLAAFWEAGRLVLVVCAILIPKAYGIDVLHTMLIYSIAQAAAQVVLFLLMYRSINHLQQIKSGEGVAE